MDELQRQAYLRSMGVDSYFPRTQLPGALASVQCLTLFAKVLDQIELNVEETRQVTDDVINPHPINSLKELFDSPLSINKMSPLITSAARQNTSRVVDGGFRVNTNNPVFSCRFYKGKRFLLLVDTIADQYAAEYDLLVKNIIFALGDELQPLNDCVFSWPMVSSSAIDQSLSVAQASLSTVIARHIEDCTLIALGSIANFLPVSESISDKVFIDPVTGYHYLFTMSAIDILHRPELKMHLWRSLSLLP